MQTRQGVFLKAARNARGKDWKPSGSVAEGDVKHHMYNESGFLAAFEQAWDGLPKPAAAFHALDGYLSTLRVE